MVALISAEGPASDRAIHALEAMATQEAFSALVSRIDLEKIVNPMHAGALANAAARMAAKLKHPTREYWAAVATIVPAVRSWFVIPQMAQPEPQDVFL